MFLGLVLLVIAVLVAYFLSYALALILGAVGIILILADVLGADLPRRR